jgi:hypothetical protein
MSSKEGAGRPLAHGDGFLRQHFMHWLESLSIFSKISESIQFISILQSLVVEENSQISIFLQDARRFVLTRSRLLPPHDFVANVFNAFRESSSNVRSWHLTSGPGGVDYSTVEALKEPSN